MHAAAKKVTVRQEMLSLDPYFIEYAIAQCGAQRFKPVFPGEHLYLGLRSKRLARPEATHTVADVAGIRLRALIGAEMDQLNKLVSFGAPFLPPLPPIFVTQMLDNAGQRRDLAAQILSLRDSRAIRGFRDWARKCMELARSPDPVKRKEAADAVVKLEGLSFEAKSSTSTIINSVKLAMQLAKGDFAGIFLGYAESAIQYFSKRPLSGLEKFSGQNVDSGKLDAFLEKNFGDKFNRNDLNSVSIFLGLAENIDRWMAEDCQIEAVADRLDSSTPGLSRPYQFTVEDPGMVAAAKKDFDELWSRGKPLKSIPRLGNCGRADAMNLYAPSSAIFVVSLVIVATALAGKWLAIPWVSDNAFWIAIGAYLVLAGGNVQRTV